MFENNYNGLNKSRADLDIDTPGGMPPTVVRPAVVAIPKTGYATTLIKTAPKAPTLIDTVATIVKSSPRIPSILDVIIAEAPKPIAVKQAPINTPKMPSTLEVIAAEAPKTVATIAPVATKTVAPVAPKATNATPAIPKDPVFDQGPVQKPENNTVRNIGIGAIVLFVLYKFLK